MHYNIISPLTHLHLSDSTSTSQPGDYQPYTTMSQPSETPMSGSTLSQLPPPQTSQLGSPFSYHKHPTLPSPTTPTSHPLERLSSSASTSSSSLTSTYSSTAFDRSSSLPLASNSWSSIDGGFAASITRERRRALGRGSSEREEGFCSTTLCEGAERRQRVGEKCWKCRWMIQ